MKAYYSFLLEKWEMFILIAKLGSVLCIEKSEQFCLSKTAMLSKTVWPTAKKDREVAIVWVSYTASLLALLFGKCIVQLSIHLFRI